jgi:hypothetical protein
MSGAVKKVVAEVVHLGEELAEHLPQGHHGAHANLEHDAGQMAHDVDQAEEKVAAAVPTRVAPPTLHKFGEDGMRGWSPQEHVFHGEQVGPRDLAGHHARPGGVDAGRELFDEASRVVRPDDVYAGYWRLRDATGKVITKPGGGDLKKFSTFWPDNWARGDIEQSVTEAYWDAVANGTRTDDGFRGFTSSGHPVRAYFDDYGIFTAFLDYPKNWKMGDPVP